STDDKWAILSPWASFAIPAPGTISDKTIKKIENILINFVCIFFPLTTLCPPIVFYVTMNLGFVSPPTINLDLRHHSNRPCEGLEEFERTICKKNSQVDFPGRALWDGSPGVPGIAFSRQLIHALEIE